jgi:hypothetical protein
MRISQDGGRRVSGRMIVATAALTGVLAGGQGVAAAATVGGGASAVEAHVNAIVIPIDAGPLPSVTLPSTGGGPLTASLANTDVLGLVTIKSGIVSTEGSADAGSAKSSVTVANVDVLGLVKATVASSNCNATTTTATGSAKVVDLTVAGIALAVADLGPNTKISLPIGTVTINEQITSAPTATSAAARRRAARQGRARTRARTRHRAARRAAATPQSITVNAVHVHLDLLGLASGDVVLGQSRCSVG